MTIKFAAKAALEMQDACNLSGVVHSFSGVLTGALWPEARRRGKGTDWVNKHPISVLFADKIADLTGVHHDMHVTDAYQECKRIADATDD